MRESSVSNVVKPELDSPTEVVVLAKVYKKEFCVDAGMLLASWRI
jgi:hypothetical protein